VIDWCVYIVKSIDGLLYTGVTNNIDRRLRQHNGEIKGGAKFTRRSRPWTVVYCKQCNSRSEAQRLEAKLKKFPRWEKLRLVEGRLIPFEGGLDS